MGRGNLHLRELRRLRPDSFATRVLRARPVLIALLIGGAFMATLFAWTFLPDQPTDQLFEGRPGGVGAEGLDLKADIRAVDPAHGEMTVRLVPTVVGERYIRGGQLREPLTLFVNDAAGKSIITYAAGSFPSATDITIAITGGRLVRYPFDRYTTVLSIFAVTSGGPADQEAVATSLGLVSSIDEVRFHVTPMTGTGVATARIIIDRPLAVRSWLVFLMVLMWGLGLGAASIAWIVIVWNEGIPFWSWGYLVGVLFALPTLRANLPGGPPNGSLVDIVSFYWAIGLVVGTLMALMITWNIRVRQQARVRAGTAGPITTQVWATRQLDSFDD
ncbi:MAG: DUF4436 family protein [Acidimicrobiia bacterium]